MPQYKSLTAAEKQIIRHYDANQSMYLNAYDLFEKPGYILNSATKSTAKIEFPG